MILFQSAHYGPADFGPQFGATIIGAAAGGYLLRGQVDRARRALRRMFTGPYYLGRW